MADSVQEWQLRSERDYDPLAYLSPRRMASIAYQFRFIGMYFPRASVLEIGVGAGLTTALLRKLGNRVTTIDVNATLNPDRVGSVTELPCRPAEFDAFLCCQVLEHLQWDLLASALRELHRVSKLGGVISVPTNRARLLITKHDSKRSGSRRLPMWSRSSQPMRNKDGAHYWELESNVTTNEFRSEVRSVGFDIVEELQPVENLYHHFFVLRK